MSLQVIGLVTILGVVNLIYVFRHLGVRYHG